MSVTTAANHSQQRLDQMAHGQTIKCFRVTWQGTEIARVIDGTWVPDYNCPFSYAVTTCGQISRLCILPKLPIVGEVINYSNCDLDNLKISDIGRMNRVTYKNRVLAELKHGTWAARPDDEFWTMASFTKNRPQIAIYSR